MNQAAFRALLDDVIDWRYKGFPPTDDVVTIGSVGAQGWNVLSGDMLYPVMLLKERALDHNIALMQRFCQEHGVSFAPHGKTPMAPQIVQRQLDAGAWGITAATTSQVRVFRAFGISHILLANQLYEPVAITWISKELDRDPSFEFLCLVDSVAQVALLDTVLAQLKPERRLAVLVELGVPGGRTGARTVDEATAVARAVHQAQHLQLAGVEGYEGVLGNKDAVEEFLQQVRTLTVNLEREGLFDQRGEIVVTAGGSTFFDQVAASLAALRSMSRPIRIILRPGAYVTHDHGFYEEHSPLGGLRSTTDRLQQALELWSVVLSRPEPDLAIAGFGKRDAPYDVGLPIPFAVRRTSGERYALDQEIVVTKLNDHHAFLRVDPELPLNAGDMIGCGISHPCTTFDKWPLLPLVDDEYAVVGAIRTFF